MLLRSRASHYMSRRSTAPSKSTADRSRALRKLSPKHRKRSASSTSPSHRAQQPRSATAPVVRARAPPVATAERNNSDNAAGSPAPWQHRARSDSSLSSLEEQALASMAEYEATCDADGMGKYGLATPQTERELLRSVLLHLRSRRVRPPNTISSYTGGSLVAWHIDNGEYFTCTFDSATRFLCFRRRDDTSAQEHDSWPVESSRDEQIAWIVDEILEFGDAKYALVVSAATAATVSLVCR